MAKKYNKIIYVRDSIERIFTYGFSWLCILYTLLNVIWTPNVDGIMKAGAFTPWNIGIIIFHMVCIYVVMDIIIRRLDVK